MPQALQPRLNRRSSTSSAATVIASIPTAGADPAGTGADLRGGAALAGAAHVAGAAGVPVLRVVRGLAQFAPVVQVALVQVAPAVIDQAQAVVRAVVVPAVAVVLAAAALVAVVRAPADNRTHSAFFSMRRATSHQRRAVAFVTGRVTLIETSLV